VEAPLRRGPAVQITQNGGFDGEESWDGQSVYYTKDQRSGVWRTPLEGGQESAVIDGPLSLWGWALAQTGIFHAKELPIGGRRHAYVIRHLGFESGQVSELFRREGSFYQTSLAVSPDERWILHSESTTPSELMLVENFH
jgi:hypothetical protein